MKLFLIGVRCRFRVLGMPSKPCASEVTSLKLSILQSIGFAVVLVLGQTWDVSAEPPPRAAEIPAGLRSFLATGCGACHRIAGTGANGEIGPDLTHLASRSTIAANLLPLTPKNLSRWIRHTQELKPGAHMPSFGMLPESETAEIVDYLMTLK